MNPLDYSKTEQYAVMRIANSGITTNSGFAADEASASIIRDMNKGSTGSSSDSTRTKDVASGGNNTGSVKGIENTGGLGGASDAGGGANPHQIPS